MSRVYEALDLKHHRPAAIKVLARWLAEDEEFRQRFERESQSAERVTHPHVLPIWDYGEENGLLFLATPLCDLDVGDLISEHGPGCRSSVRCASSGRSRGRWTGPTAAGSSTATSSPRTSCSSRGPTPTTPTWRTSASRAPRSTRRSRSPATRRGSRPPTRRRSSGAARRSAPPRTSTRWPPPSTRACPGTRRSIPGAGRRCATRTCRERAPELDGVVHGLPRALAEAVARGLAKEPERPLRLLPRARRRGPGGRPALPGLTTDAPREPTARGTGAAYASTQISQPPASAPSRPSAPAPSEPPVVRARAPRRRRRRLAPAPPAPPPRLRARRRRGEQRRRLPLLIGGVVAAVALIAVAAVLLLGGGDDPSGGAGTGAGTGGGGGRRWWRRRRDGPGPAHRQGPARAGRRHGRPVGRQLERFHADPHQAAPGRSARGRPSRPSPQPFGVATANGRVWAIGGSGALAEIDARSGKRAAADEPADPAERRDRGGLRRAVDHQLDGRHRDARRPLVGPSRRRRTTVQVGTGPDRHRRRPRRGLGDEPLVGDARQARPDDRPGQRPVRLPRVAGRRRRRR